MADRHDNDWDPVPELSPFFKGLVFACGLVAVGLAVWGMVMIAVAVMVGLAP